MFRKFAVLYVVLAVTSSVCFASNPFDDFKSYLTGVATSVAQDRLDNFAKDLGAVLGGGAFHQGKSLGFPGFDVGIHIPGQKTDDKNDIVKAAGVDTIMIPIAQAEIGLPKKIDLIVRAMSYSDASIIGFGLRYGLLKPSIPGMPSVSVQAVQTMLNVSSGDNKLKATTTSVSAVASIDLPIITPYAGIGLDSTEVTPDSTIIDLKGKASTSRIEAGVNLSLVPFTYLQLGGTLINGTMGYTAGLGVKF